MWQGWIAFLIGLWLTISSFLWHIQTNLNLLISGIILTIIGFWAEKSWEGIMLGFLGIYVIGCGCTNYLALSINFFLTGITVMAIAFLCATINKRSQYHLFG